ncbi:MAG: MFS transporter, partial [Muribaculaceae bacterium]|nr:MFS transporter [Muribaculaceae bacterium]
MRDQIKETIATRAWARWTVLAIVSFTMMAGYVVAKEMSPLQFMLEKATADGGMGWTSGEFGIFAGSRGFFNVFLLMLFVGGIILDKMGVRFTGILSCVLMLAGSAAVYGAITYTSPDPMWSVPVLGTVKRQVVLAALGFAFFGIGYEMCGITVSKAIVRWFSGKEMALAMGLQVAMARLGTALALGFSPIIALNWGLPRPILIGVFCVGVGLIAYLYYCTMDRRLDKDK